MSRLQFTLYLRALLGRAYSVADEEHHADGTLRLLLARRGADQILVVETIDGWVRSLPSAPTREERVMLKHLAICIRRYFSHPEYLPAGTFSWPGTPQNRMTVRLALDPRKWRRAGARVQEDS